MSILHVVRCEQYEQCKQEFSFGTNSVASDFAPETWITLFEGNPRLSEGWHFCSDLCLARWTIERIASASVDLGKSEDWLVKLTDTPVWSIVRKPVQQEPQEQPACKARRFLMFDEQANSTEGVKWGNGYVSLDGSSQHCLNFHCQGYFRDWDEFKAAHEGSGVQWIDQEVAE